MMPRWYLLLLLLAIQCIAGVRPNVLVILTDDQGRGDYSAFGTKDIRTPNIDRIFHEGMALDNFRANSCVCSPTRAALLTGRYPDLVGVPGVIREEMPEDSWGYLSPSAVLLPKLLKAAGYHTGMVGKWHLGLSSPNTPTERGFDYFHGFLGDMMDDYYSHLRHGQNFMRLGVEPVNPSGHATDVFTDWACEYVDQRRDSEQPFFLYLAYNAPHDPIQPPADWENRVLTRESGIDAKRAKLVALIEHMDAGIGRVLDALERNGQAANTMVIFTSDNGGRNEIGAKNGPWREGKGHMYEGGLRVPCAVRWPKQVRAGGSSNSPFVTMDIFPTVLEAAQVESSRKIEAVSFLPTLLGKPGPVQSRDFYFVRRDGGLLLGGKTIEAMERWPWKLLQDRPFGPQELYNLETDALETSNMAGKEPKVLREMAQALRMHIQQGGQVPWQPVTP